MRKSISAIHSPQVVQVKTFFDCIPCFVRQTLDSIRMVTDDEVVHERVLREVLRAASEMDLRESPPAMGHRIHRIMRDVSGQVDPYRAMKDRFNRAAMALYPALKARVAASAHRLETAVRLAMAGNVIDLAIYTDLDESHVLDAVDQAVAEPFNGDIDAFAGAVDHAKRILYLADNAGEIVFDRVLIEELPRTRVTVAVRGMPIINDATMADAQAVGLTERVEVIDNGADVPGTILRECSEAFRERFAAADLIIAKGQGNYETLSETGKDIFFILKAKCPVIARDIGCQVGSLVLRRSRPTEACSTGFGPRSE